MRYGRELERQNLLGRRRDMDHVVVFITHVVKEELIVARHDGFWLEILQSEDGGR